MSASIRIEGDLSGFQEAIKKLKNLDKARLNRIIAEVLRESTLERFQQEEDPQGRKWKKSLRAASQNGGSGKTLAMSGGLKVSLSTHANPTGLAVGTNKIYAGVHQFGGEVRAKRKPYLTFKIGDRFVRLKKVTVPARPFLGISDTDQKEVAETVNDFIKEVVR